MMASLFSNCPVIENVCEEKPLSKKKDCQGTSSSKGVSKLDSCEISPGFLWVILEESFSLNFCARIIYSLAVICFQCTSHLHY